MTDLSCEALLLAREEVVERHLDHLAHVKHPLQQQFQYLANSPHPDDRRSASNYTAPPQELNQWKMNRTLIEVF